MGILVDETLQGKRTVVQAVAKKASKYQRRLGPALAMEPYASTQLMAGGTVSAPLPVILSRGHFGFVASEEYTTKFYPKPLDLSKSSNCIELQMSIEIHAGRAGRPGLPRELSTL